MTDPGRTYEAPYWGGYTEHGQLLHLAVGSAGLQYARSACGLALTGGASAMPPDAFSGSATCQRCEAAAFRTRRGCLGE